MSTNNVKLKYVIKHINTGLNPRNNFILDNGMNFYVTTKNIDGLNVILDEKCDNIDDRAIRLINARADLKDGDVLFSGIGTIGRTALITETPKNWNISESLYSIRVNEKINNKFLYYVLNSPQMIDYYEHYQTGSAQKGLRIEDLKNFKFNLIDLKLQEKAIKFLDKKINSVDKVIEDEIKLIEKLKEYRQLLITESVTKGLNKNVTLKNSGSAWIGKINSDFEIVRLKYCLDGYADGTHGTYSRIDNGEPLLSAKNVLETGLNITNFESMISKKDYQSIISNGFPKKGDILLCCVGTIGRCIIFNESNPYAFQRSVIMLRTNNKINNKYLYYFMNSKCALGQEKAMANKSAQEGIYQESVKEIKVVLPSMDVQKKISDFLDKKCPSIDKLIKLKEEKIELLEKYKKSLIYECVTGKRKVNG